LELGEGAELQEEGLEGAEPEESFYCESAWDLLLGRCPVGATPLPFGKPVFEDKRQARPMSIYTSIPFLFLNTGL
jgi:hypothetical protein